MTGKMGAPEVCPLCKEGPFATRMEELAFLQWTPKGRVRCLVTVTMQICQKCRFKTWDGEAEALIDAAVRRACAKLP